MTGTTHAVIGAILGMVLEQPLPAFAGGVASHVVLDLLPHHDYGDRRTMMVLDGLGVCGVLVAAVRARRYDAMLGALGGIAPDLEHVVGRGNPHGPSPRFVSHGVEHGAQTPALGILAEALAVTAALAALGLLGGRRRKPRF